MSRKWTKKDDEMRKAAMQRRWGEFQRVKENRPYMQMQSVGDSRDHPECTEMDGIIVHIENPWLKENWPPHRKMCRCTVRSLSPRQMEREGLSVTDDGLLP